MEGNGRSAERESGKEDETVEKVEVGVRKNEVESLGAGVEADLDVSPEAGGGGGNGGVVPSSPSNKDKISSTDDVPAIRGVDPPTSIPIPILTVAGTTTVTEEAADAEDSEREGDAEGDGEGDADLGGAGVAGGKRRGPKKKRRGKKKKGGVGGVVAVGAGVIGQGEEREKEKDGMDEDNASSLVVPPTPQTATTPSLVVSDTILGQILFFNDR